MACLRWDFIGITTHSTTIIASNRVIESHFNRDLINIHSFSDLQVNGQREVSFVMVSELALNPINNIDLSFTEKLSDDSKANKVLIFINSMLLTPLNMIDDQ